jgi:hypothetical protein
MEIHTLWMIKTLENRYQPLPMVYPVLYMMRVISIGILKHCRGNFINDKNKEVFRNLFIDEFSENLFCIIFVLNAIIQKKIVQLKSYLFLLMFRVTSVLLLRTELSTYISSGSIPMNCVDTALVLHVLEFIITLYLIPKYRGDFNWFYFKKFGASGAVQEAHKVRETYVVVKKIGFLYFFQNATTLRLSFHGKYALYYRMALIFGISLSYSAIIMAYWELNRESPALRKTLIGTLVCIGMYRLALHFIIFTYVIFVDSKDKLSSVFDLINDMIVIALLVFLGIKDYGNFGMGLSRH